MESLYYKENNPLLFKMLLDTILRHSRSDATEHIDSGTEEDDIVANTYQHEKYNNELSTLKPWSGFRN